MFFIAHFMGFDLQFWGGLWLPLFLGWLLVLFSLFCRCFVVGLSLFFVVVYGCGCAVRLRVSLHVAV